MTDHLKTAAALLPLVSLGVAGVSSGDLLVALFVIGVVYMTWFLLGGVVGMTGWLAVRHWLERREPTHPTDLQQRHKAAVEERVGYWIMYVAFLLAIAFPIMWASVSSDSFQRTANDFEWTHVAGIIAVAICAVAIGTRFAPGRQVTTRSCPDCAETVLVQAIKCKHCGARMDAAT